jgi:type IV secretory pathway VirB3-like protein
VAAPDGVPESVSGATRDTTIAAVPMTPIFFDLEIIFVIFISLLVGFWFHCCTATPPTAGAMVEAIRLT